MSNQVSLESWIKNNLGINLIVQTFEKQFSNGYYFGEILYAYLLNPQFKEAFVNRNQPVYINRNFDLLKPLFSNFLGIDLNQDMVKEIINERVGVAKKLILKMRTVLEDKYEDNLKVRNKDFLTDAQRSLNKKVKEQELNPSLNRIELRMVPFEEEYIKQLKRAQEIREIEEQKYRETIQMHRQVRISNLKHNHNYMKEWEKKHKELWKLSRQEQKDLKNTNVEFELVMTQGILSKEDIRVKASKADVEGGIKAFEESANRLGIELEHVGFGEKPPLGSKQRRKKEFNSIATMQKINSKIDKIDANRKEKDSRNRKLAVTQKEAEESMKRQNDENEKLLLFKELSKSTVLKSSQMIMEAQRMDFIKENRREFYEKKDFDLKNSVNTSIKNLKTMSNEKWEQKRKEVLLQQKVVMLEEREKKYEKHYRECDDILAYMLDMVEICAKQLGVNNNASGSRNQTLEGSISKKNPLESRIGDKDEKFSSIISDGQGGGFSSIFKDKNQMRSMMEVKEESNKVPDGAKLSAEQFQLPFNFYRELEEKFIKFEPLEKKDDLVFDEDVNRSQAEQKQILADSTNFAMSKYLTGSFTFTPPLAYNFFVDENAKDQKILAVNSEVKVGTLPVDDASIFEGSENSPDAQESQVQAEDKIKTSLAVKENAFKYQVKSQFTNKLISNSELSKIVEEIVDLIDPIKEKKFLPYNLPNHLPLKISLMGPKKSGLKTLAKGLEKILPGLVTVDLDQVLIKCVNLAKAKRRNDILLLKQQEEERILQEAIASGDKKAAATAAAKKKPQKTAGQAKGKKGDKNDDEITEFTEEDLIYIKLGLDILFEWEKAKQANMLADMQAKSNSQQNENLAQDNADLSQDVDATALPLINTELKYRVLTEHLRITFKESSDILKNAQEYEKLKAEAEEKRKLIEEQKKLELEQQEEINKAGATKGKKVAPLQPKPKAGKQPAKGQKKPGEEDEELSLVDPLFFPYTKGFILLNFPKNEEEVKYLDTMFTGFLPMEKRLSKRAERKRERIAKIMQISPRQDEEDAFPTFDLVITPKISHETILQRVSSSLLDPETGVVYNPQINPVPEQDKKLKERLVKCEIDHESIKNSMESFEVSFPKIDQWYRQFGWKISENEIVKPVIVLEDESGEKNLDVMETLEEEERKKLSEIQKIFAGIKLSSLLNLKSNVEKILQEKYKILANAEQLKDKFYDQDAESQPDQTESKHSNNQQSSKVLDFESKVRISKNSFARRQSSVIRSLNRGGDSRSVVTNRASRQEKVLKKSSEFLKLVISNYVDRLTKTIKEMKETLNQNQVFLREVQKKFYGHMERDEQVLEKFEDFNSSLKMFIDEQSRMYQMSYAKEQLVKKVEQLQEYIWKDLQAKKQKCLKQKSRIEAMKVVPNFISKMLGYLFKVIVLELNKLVYFKDMLVCYFAYKANKPEYEYYFEVESLDFGVLEQQLSDLSDYSDEEIVNKTSELRQRYDSFFFDVDKRISEQGDRFPKAIVSLLRTEISACKQRISNMAAFTVHKIKKGKARYTNLIYRIEDWIVDTIKYESDSIYSYAKKTKAAILNSERTFDDSLLDYHPTDTNRVVDFKQGPSGFQLPEFDKTDDKTFSFCQLYIFFNDMINIIPLNNETGKVSKILNLDSIYKKLKFRAKNFEISFYRYMPKYWKDLVLSYKDIQAVFLKLAEKSLKFNDFEVARYTQEQETWQNQKQQEKISKVLEEKKIQRDQEMAEEKARRVQLKELEEEQKRLEEEQNAKKQKKDPKKDVLEIKNINSLSAQTIGLESASLDDATIQAELGLQTDEELENAAKIMDLELSEDYEPSSKSVFDIAKDTHTDQDSGLKMIRVELLFMVFTILNYPIPTVDEIQAYEKVLGTKKLSFLEFVRAPSWMDKYDEKQIAELSPESQYLTVNYKKLLFWIFQSRDGKLTGGKLISALKCFQTSSKRQQTFFEMITQGVGIK